MVIFRLRSPLAAALVLVVLAALAGVGLLRVDETFTWSSDVVVSGGWGAAPGEFGRATGVDGRPRGPQALAVDGAGNVVVADSMNSRVQVFSGDGRLLELFPVPSGLSTGGSDGDRASAFGLLQACLYWGVTFRPVPEVSGPAPAGDRPVAAGEGVTTTAHSGPYLTGIDLAPGSWSLDSRTGRLDPTSGPEVYLLAGWDGVLIATDVTGARRWVRDLLTDPGGARPEIGYLLDLDVLPGEGVVVSGYVLLSDRLVYFVRRVREAEPGFYELAAYSLTRDGSVRVEESLPLALEVESVAVGLDGLLYVVAAAPPPEGGGGASLRPFARDVWIYSRRGSPRGRLTLDCGTYTRYLRLVGVDGRGLVYARLGATGVPGSLAIFDSRGRLLLSLPLAEGTEVAAAYLGRDGALYLSEAGEDGYKVIRYRVRSLRRLVPRWAAGG